MNRHFKILTLLLITATSPVFGGFSGTFTLTSDYDWRGWSQSAGDPAVQGSVDFDHSGFYAGIWGSTIDFGDASDANSEVDYYFGYSGHFGGTGATWDVGYLYYSYPGDSGLNWGEVHFGIAVGPFDSTLYYSNDYLSVIGERDSGWHWDFNFNHAWDNGWSVFGHAGYTWGDVMEDPYPLASSSYWDVSAGGGYTYNSVYFELKGVSTTVSNRWQIDSGPGRNDFRLIASINLSF
jgi:uncharacterized protein (TIGR02001 family)